MPSRCGWSFLVFPHEAAVPLDIWAQYGREFSFHLIRAHKFISFKGFLKVNLHSFGSCETFDRAGLPVDSFPAEFNLTAYLVVGMVWVVMKETQAFYTCFDGQVRGLANGGVTPATSEFVLFFCELRVMKQQVRTLAEFYVLPSAQPSLVREIQFIISKKYKGLIPLYEFVAIAAIGVTERYWADLQSVQAAIAGFHIGTLTLKIKFGPQEVKVHGEIGCLHLMSEILSDGILGM